MKVFNQLILGSVCSAVLIFSNAMAMQPVPYFSVYGGSAWQDIGIWPVVFSGNSSRVEGSTYGFSVGTQLNPYFGIEAGYQSLSDTTVLGTPYTHNNYMSLYGVRFRIPLQNRFALYIKLGVARVHNSYYAVSGQPASNQSAYVGYTGFGASYGFTPNLVGDIAGLVTGARDDITSIMSSTMGLTYYFG